MYRQYTSAQVTHYVQTSIFKPISKLESSYILVWMQCKLHVMCICQMHKSKLIHILLDVLKVTVYSYNIISNIILKDQGDFDVLCSDSFKLLYVFVLLTCFGNPWHYSMTFNKWNAEHCRTVDKKDWVYKVLDHPNVQNTENTKTRGKKGVNVTLFCKWKTRHTIIKYFKYIDWSHFILVVFNYYVFISNK